MKIVIYSLGCKVNQYESDCIMNELMQKGFDVSTKLENADVFILNTCAVTNEAERKSRGMIAKFVKLNPNCRVFVCGCASQNSKEQFLKYDNVVEIIGNIGKSKIVEQICDLSKILDKNTNKFADINACRTYEEFGFSSPSRTRANLKIQDGCDNFCSYCLIPYIRGRSRSRELDKIVEEAKALSQVAKEIVLTGINISDYKIDGQLALDKLMIALKDVDARIRIGSLEVNIITDEFLKTLQTCTNFCPHFHLSMQSGCDKILKLMNRHYIKEDFIAKTELIRKYFPNACITTDVICGFPTETEEDFRETIETIKKAQFYFMHIFPYSLRKGTKASFMEQVDKSVAKDRVERLIALRDEQRQAFLDKIKDTEQNVILEEMEDGYWVGHSEYYIKCYIKGDYKQDESIKVKTVKLYKDGAIAEPFKML